MVLAIFFSCYVAVNPQVSHWCFTCNVTEICWGQLGEKSFYKDFCFFIIVACGW